MNSYRINHLIHRALTGISPPTPTPNYYSDPSLRNPILNHVRAQGRIPAFIINLTTVTATTPLTRYDQAIALLYATQSQLCEAFIRTFDLGSSDLDSESNGIRLKYVELDQFNNMSEEERSVGSILWNGLCLHYKYDAKPDDALLVSCWNSQGTQDELLNTLGCEYSTDDTPSDTILFHLNKTLTAALESLDPDLTYKTIKTIQKRYEKLKQLHPNSIYSSAPDWFTRLR